MPDYNSHNLSHFDDDYDPPTVPARRAAYRVPQAQPTVTRPAPPNNVGRAYPPLQPSAVPIRQPVQANQNRAIARPTYRNDYEQNRQMVRQQPPPPQRAAYEPSYGASSNESNLKIALMGLGLIVVLGASYLVVSLVLNTWQNWQDDVTYGMPRTTKLEANVGHNEIGGAKTLFVAHNLHGQIAIIEIPGSDPSKTRVIVGPHLFGKDKDLVPVKLQVKDVNLDGQMDLLATAADQQLIYINENGNFRPINDQERAKLIVATQSDKESSK